MSELESFIEAQKRKLEQEKASIFPRSSNTQDRSRTSPRGYKPDSVHDDSGVFVSPQTKSQPKVDKDVEFGGLNLGGYEKVQQKLRQERQEDYRKHLAEKNLRSTGRAELSRANDRKSPFSETPVGREQIQREKIRDVDEPYLGERDLPRSWRRGKENWDVEDSPRDTYSRDPYGQPENLFETYEEKLRKKRAQERRYRGPDDPGFDDNRPMRLTASQYKYNSRSDGYLSRRHDYDDDYEQGYSSGRPRGQRDRRLQESKRVRFHEYKDNDDDMWLKPRRRLTDEYEDDEDDLFDWARSRMQRPPRRNSAHEERHYPKEESFQRSKTDNTIRSQSAPLETEGGLFGGSQGSYDANHKRKEQYKKELQAQMEEQKQIKKREKMSRLGIVENEVKSREPAHISPAEYQPSKRSPQGLQQQQQQQQALNLARDNYGPSARPSGHPALYPSPYDDPYFYYGTMEAGMNQGPLFGGLQGPGPSGYGGFGGSGFGGAARSASGMQDVEKNLSSNNTRGSSTPAKPAPAQTSRPTLQPPGGQTSLGFGALGNGGGTARDDAEKKRAAQQAYQEELKIQMEIKQRKKQQEREERERYEQKKNEEIARYDPWGKGGAGAPLKDSSGHAITDLRSMHQLSKDGAIVSPRDPPKDSFPEPQNVEPVVAETNADFSGGAKHVGFGRSDPLKEPQPQDEAKKVAKLEYQEFLKKQVEENERRKKEEQEKIRKEDELQERRMEEQRKKIQLEFEKEQEAARQKEEAVRRKNEEQQAAQEAKKKEAERKRKEMEEQRQTELRRKLDEELATKKAAGGGVDSVSYVRTDSPPVPGVRKRQQNNDQVDSGRRSPPVPALVQQQNSRQEHAEVARYPTPPPRRNPEPAIAADADQDVLSQLTALRQQLKNEENRIQSQMDHSTAAKKYSSSRRHEEVSSARKRGVKRDVDVFERALSNRAAISKKDTETFSAADEFNRMKSDDTSSLAGEFRSRFPVPATTASTLDLQQQEFLREQEDHLSSLRSGGGGSTNHPQATGSIHQMSNRPISRTSMLESDSQFLALEDSSNVDLPPESMGIRPRQSSARQRRRMKQLEELAKDPKPFGDLYKPPTPGGFSLNSITSFNVDEVALRNEERLRRLESTRKDERKGDPDQVLRRFIQERQRPPTQASETSLEAETSFEPI